MDPRRTLFSARSRSLSFSELSGTNALNSSSFKYDPLGTALKNTQQLNVDWSKFENHTFFSAAEVKVNTAFDLIVNRFPFDGTKAEHEAFNEMCTGFDTWVLTRFPKFRGALHFSGTAVSEDTDGTLGTWVRTRDHEGFLYPNSSKTATGLSVLSPGSTGSLSLEMQLHLPAISSSNQVIAQHINGSTFGWSLHLLETGSVSAVRGQFVVSSGSSNIDVTFPLVKGQYNHICVELDRTSEIGKLNAYVGETLVASSSRSNKIGDLGTAGATLYIGSGSSFTFNGSTFLPRQTLSGTMDEFRLFHALRSPFIQKKYAKRSIYAEPDLKLYYKFNEPSASLGPTGDQINSIVLDSSGHSLHALVSNMTSSLRMNVSGSSDSPMSLERDELSPILFPAHADVVSLNSELLTSASLYDAANPNLITKLVPQHVLLEGSAFEGFDTIEGNIGNTYGGTDGPGDGKMGGVQLLLAFLYAYSRMFDEMKMYIDAFSTVRHVSYDGNDNVPDNFILDLVRTTGFDIPTLFNDSTLQQYIDADDVLYDYSSLAQSLRSVQVKMLKRVLINVPNIVRSKGTQHAIKVFMRSIGIDPDTSVRFREKGGPSYLTLSGSRETKTSTGVMLSFNSGSFVVSPYLSSSRLEVGAPVPAGSMVLKHVHKPHGISNDANDGLLTSGSWTVEGIFKWNNTDRLAMKSNLQSIVRLCVTGSMTGSLGVVANLVATTGSNELVLYVRPNSATTAPVLTLPIGTPSSSLFNGEKWNFAFGRVRNDFIGSNVSSSYFLKLASQRNGVIDECYTTSSFFLDSAGGGTNILQSKDSTYNASGTFLAIGDGQTITVDTNRSFLNSSSMSPSGTATGFSGRISHLRFWSKDLNDQEWFEHVRNSESTGVEKPLTNWNYATSPSGSFQRMRMNVISKQQTTIASGSAGTLYLLDMSENGNHLTGSGFLTTTASLQTEFFTKNSISSYFDEAVSDEKIRVRSLLNPTTYDSHYVQTAPMYELQRSEESNDDTKFSIDISLVEALNRDIINTMATLDEIGTAIGSPEVSWSIDYPALEKLSDVYFNRIKKELNFKSFFEFYRWFDKSISRFVLQLVPNRTNFKGINMLVEPHMLERSKYVYPFNETYLTFNNRQEPQRNLQLQLIEGSIKSH